MNPQSVFWKVLPEERAFDTSEATDGFSHITSLAPTLYTVPVKCSIARGVVVVCCWHKCGTEVPAATSALRAQLALLSLSCPSHRCKDRRAELQLVEREYRQFPEHRTLA